MYTCCQHDLITKVWVFVLLLTRSYTFLLLHEMPRASDSSNNDIQLIINWIQWQGNCRSDGRVCVMIGNELITSLPLPMNCMNWFECKPHSTFLSDRNRCTHHQQQTSMSIKYFFVYFWRCSTQQFIESTNLFSLLGDIMWLGHEIDYY